MRILAIDTAQWRASIAVWEEGSELAFAETTAERDQAALLPSLLDKVLDSHTFDLILVNSGPGSFTGIRLGLAFAQGLSMGFNIPVKGIDGFTIAYQTLESPKDVLILLEARRDDVYGQFFEKGKPHPPRSYTMAEIEAFSAPIVRGEGGARLLAQAFFSNSSLAGPAVPLYIREANVTLQH